MNNGEYFSQDMLASTERQEMARRNAMGLGFIPGTIGLQEQQGTQGVLQAEQTENKKLLLLEDV